MDERRRPGRRLARYHGVRRNRGRRGLDSVAQLRKMSGIQVEISPEEFTAFRGVDLKLIEAALKVVGGKGENLCVDVNGRYDLEEALACGDAIVASAPSDRSPSTRISLIREYASRSATPNDAGAVTLYVTSR